MLRTALLALAIALSAALPANAAGDLPELEKRGQVFGAAGRCAEKTGVKLENRKAIENLTLRILLPYKKYGMEAARTFATAMDRGMALANSASAARCREILGHFVPIIRDLGADASYWQKAHDYYSGKSGAGAPKKGR